MHVSRFIATASNSWVYQRHGVHSLSLRKGIAKLPLPCAQIEPRGIGAISASSVKRGDSMLVLSGDLMATCQVIDVTSGCIEVCVEDVVTMTNQRLIDALR